MRLVPCNCGINAVIARMIADNIQVDLDQLPYFRFGNSTRNLKRKRGLVLSESGFKGPVRGYLLPRQVNFTLQVRLSLSEALFFFPLPL